MPKLLGCCLTLLLNLLCSFREGARVIWGYVNRILGQPSLIRESSMTKFPWSGLASGGANKLFSYGSVAGAQSKSPLGGIVLHPSLQRRVEHLARATANTKSHEAPFRNMLFYGPPGTGKTMVAREMARKSVCISSALASLFLFSLRVC